MLKSLNLRSIIWSAYFAFKYIVTATVATSSTIQTICSEGKISKTDIIPDL